METEEEGKFDLLVTGRSTRRVTLLRKGVTGSPGGYSPRHYDIGRDVGRLLSTFTLVSLLPLLVL